MKTRKLTANWAFESIEDVQKIYKGGWEDFPTPPASSSNKAYNSVTETILRKLWYLYKLYKHKKKAGGIEEELTAVMAAEIREEIDQEILKYITKAAQVPKELL